MKLHRFILASTLLFSCQSIPTISDNQALIPQESAMFLKDSHYLPVLESDGINMLPEGFNKVFLKPRELISGFEIITNNFSDAQLVRISTQNKQIDSYNRFGDAWELRGSLNETINPKILGESGFSSSFIINKSLTNKDIFLLPNVDQLIFDYKTINMHRGKYTDAHTKNILSAIVIEIAKIPPKTIESMTWSIDPDKNECSNQLSIIRNSFNFQYDEVNQTYSMTLTNNPLTVISFTVDEIFAKYNKYPKNFLKNLYKDVELEDCSFFLTLNRTSEINFENIRWEKLYSAYPDNSDSFKDLNITLPSLKSSQ